MSTGCAASSYITGNATPRDPRAGNRGVPDAFGCGWPRFGQHANAGRRNGDAASIDKMERFERPFGPGLDIAHRGGSCSSAFAWPTCPHAKAGEVRIDPHRRRSTTRRRRQQPEQPRALQRGPSPPPLPSTAPAWGEGGRWRRRRDRGTALQTDQRASGEGSASCFPVLGASHATGRPLAVQSTGASSLWCRLRHCCFAAPWTTAKIPCCSGLDNLAQLARIKCKSGRSKPVRRQPHRILHRVAWVRGVLPGNSQLVRAPSLHPWGAPHRTSPHAKPRRDRGFLRFLRRPAAFTGPRVVDGRVP